MPNRLKLDLQHINNPAITQQNGRTLHWRSVKSMSDHDIASSSNFYIIHTDHDEHFILVNKITTHKVHELFKYAQDLHLSL